MTYHVTQLTQKVTPFTKTVIIHFQAMFLELVSKELNHLAAVLHVNAGGLIFMK